MTIFLGLLLAHLLYDFHWQGPFIAEMKGKSKFFLFIHALTWALLLGAVLWAFGALVWWHIPFLLVTHYRIDWFKAYYTKQPQLREALWTDQLLHLLTIVTVCL